MICFQHDYLQPSEGFVVSDATRRSYMRNWVAPMCISLPCPLKALGIASTSSVETSRSRRCCWDALPSVCSLMSHQLLTFFSLFPPVLAVLSPHHLLYPLASQRCGGMASMSAMLEEYRIFRKDRQGKQRQDVTFYVITNDFKMSWDGWGDNGSEWKGRQKQVTW